jgi:hypothetical protein
MTIQIQQLLFCTAVFVVIGAAGLFFAAKERRARTTLEDQVFEGKAHAGEAVYRVDPVMTKEGVIFVRPGKARDVVVANRVEQAYPGEKIYPGPEESKKSL